ncbi:RNA-binding protein 4 [Fasciola gigantica]|uniref:RNA-binding protein 4 n=1 Tax=Fasciola gigantica TaxID=46835 RepID=A0A504YYY0_FASGI|nr:RNA-binding protein 4 [Fasciola gigantica]
MSGQCKMVKLFVGNLNPQSKAVDLRKKFEAYGKVTECDIVNNYGFVHMEKEADAEAALNGLQNSVLDGVKINVERSHGKRTGGPGPMRRRPEGRFRDYPPERFRGGPPPRYMGGPPPPPPPPPRMGRYGPGWDDGYGGPYGPPPPRASPRGGYDYHSNGTSGRYPPPPERAEPVRPPPRGAGREPLPPPPAPGSGYRGPPMSEPLQPTRVPLKGGSTATQTNSRYDNYADIATTKDTASRLLHQALDRTIIMITMEITAVVGVTMIIGKVNGCPRAITIRAMITAITTTVVIVAHQFLQGIPMGVRKKVSQFPCRAE